ncbi:MAG: hypothetical protein PHX61_11690, partial [Alphaproteobacteria bacterium]|nr:hypothetical protein [Alphaproteobacteria bacterium]
YSVPDGILLTWEYHVLCTAQVTGVSVGSVSCSMVGINIPETLELVGGNSSGLYKLAGAILRLCNELDIRDLLFSVCEVLGALQNGLYGGEPSIGRPKSFSAFHGAMKSSSK